MILNPSTNKNNGGRPDSVHTMSLRDRGTKSAPSRIPLSKKKKQVKESSSKKKEVVEECSSKKKEPVEECSSKKKEPVEEWPSKKKEPVEECPSKKKEPVKECSSKKKASKKKEPVKECSSKEKKPVKECSTEKEPLKECLPKKKEPVKECVSKKKEPVKECSPNKKEPVKECSSKKKEIVKECSSKKKEIVKECSPKTKEIVLECSSKTKEIVLECVSKKKEPVKECSSKKKEPVEECPSKKKEPVKECASKKKEPVKECSSKEKKPVKECSTEKEPLKECLPKKKEPVKECVSKKKEPVKECSSKKKEPVKECSSKKKEIVKECSSKKKEPVKECSSKKKEIVKECSSKKKEIGLECSSKTKEIVLECVFKKKEPVKECSSKKKEQVKKCSSDESNLKDEIIEFLSPKAKISARRVLRKPKDDSTTHPDPLNGGNSLGSDGSVIKDNGRESLSHPRSQPENANGNASSYDLRRKRKTVIQPEKANGAASSYELRRKRKKAMPSGCSEILIVDDLETNKTGTSIESQTVPSEPILRPRNQLEKDNSNASSYELRRKRKMAMLSGCNGILIVDDLGPNEMATRVESQKVPSKAISHQRNQLEEANSTASSYELRRKRKMATCSGSNGKIIVGDLEPNKMATRVESQTIHGLKKINAEQISKNSVIPETIRSLSLPNGDIAKGQESVVITVANNINDEKLPFFHYIPRNAFFENAYVNVSFARIGDDNCCANCDGNCLSLETPCVCSYETGCKFAYTTDGLVKEDFLNECISMNRDPEKQCKVFCDECPLKKSKNKDTSEPCEGHLVRKFIKECWLKCGCSQLCGNRIVQRGITRKLQVFMTPSGVGWGLRTLEDLPKGAFVCEYVGEVLTNGELSERNFLRKSKGEKHSYPVLLDADWCVEKVLDEDALCLDATYYGNVARFINHRCHDSNMVEIPVEVDTPDHHYYHLAFFTTREVKALEELTWDYGIDFDDLDHPIKAFSCQCGSKSCRNTKRSSHNKNRSRSKRRRRGW